MMAIAYHPRNPREQVLRLALAAFAIVYSTMWFVAHAKGDEPSRYGRPEACTVIIGGCSGVCVSAEGHILTAGHCGCESGVDVKFRDGRTVTAKKVFDTGNEEGVEVFDCEGSGYPYMSVSPRPQHPGDDVFSYGYPLNAEGVQVMKYGSGKHLRADVDSEHKGDPIYWNITTDLGVSPGWSGGPLFNDHSEVIGILTGFQKGAPKPFTGIIAPIAPIPGLVVHGKENMFIGWSLVREACEATIDPPSTLTCYVWPKGCINCTRFEKDCDACDMNCMSGTFAGMPVQFRFTQGTAPRFSLNGKTKVGYAGKADLLTWVQSARPAPVAEPRPTSTPPRRAEVPREQPRPEPIGWQRREEQRPRDRQSMPVPPPPVPPVTPETHDQYEPVAEYEEPPQPRYGDPDAPIDWMGIRIIACFNLNNDSLLSLRGLGVAKAEELLTKVCDEHGVPVRVKVASRSLNPEGYDRIVSVVGSLERIHLVALIPLDSDKASGVKGIILRKIEGMADQYLDGTPLTVVFERSDPKLYLSAYNAVNSYSGLPSSGEPFRVTDGGIVAILTRRLRIAEWAMNMLNKWRGKAVEA